MDDQTTRCAQCGHKGPAQLFEPFNTAGNLVCRAHTLCQLRQQRADPAALLGTLLREFERHAKGQGSELDTLSIRQLAELEYDLNGDGTEAYGGGFHAALQARMMGKGAVFAEVIADRQARKRRRAALQAAETRRRNQAAAGRLPCTLHGSHDPRAPYCGGVDPAAYVSQLAQGQVHDG